MDCDYEVLTVDDNTESALATVKVMANGFLRIEFSETLMGKKQIKIIDMMGRVVFLAETLDDVLVIDFSNRPSGVFFLSVADNRGKHHTQKFIKQKL